jgi:DNA-directed RNA polymerase subunit RPC12/RpoP
MKKVCSNCGKELKDNELFCSNCGTKYVEPKEEKVTKEEKAVKEEKNTKEEKTDKDAKPVTKTVAVAPANNGKADLSIAGFVCSLVGFLCCCGGIVSIVGLVLSIIGLVNINNGSVPNGKKGLAIAGIVIGAVAIILSIVLSLFAVGSGSLINEVMNEIERNAYSYR